MADQIQDSKNPMYLFQGIDSSLLSQIVKGEIDPVDFAKRELANRGFDADGVWVGFDKAREIHKINIQRVNGELHGHWFHAEVHGGQIISLSIYISPKSGHEILVYEYDNSGVYDDLLSANDPSGKILENIKTLALVLYDDKIKGPAV